MGLFSKDIKSMDDLFLHTLRDIFYAENQIVKALPKLIEKATNRELMSGLSKHLHETEGQIARLEQVFAKLGQTPRGIDCPAIDGLIKEADEVAGEVDDTKVLDAAIIGSAQAVEHYEISRYGTLIAWAEELGHDNVISLLNANLKEEKAADKKLNALAEGTVNRRATGAGTGRDRAAPRRLGPGGVARPDEKAYRQGNAQHSQEKIARVRHPPGCFLLGSFQGWRARGNSGLSSLRGRTETW